MDLYRIIVQRSFGHPLLKLATVSGRRCKNAVAQVFAFKLKFASNCLLKWFNRKFKIQNMEIDHKQKNTYEAFNPIDWKKTKCVIFKFPLIINAKGRLITRFLIDI